MVPKKVLVLLGGGWHDFEACGRILESFLLATGRFDVTRTTDRNALATLPRSRYAAAIVYAQGGELTANQERGIIRFVENGGGLVGIHCGNDSFVKNEGYMKLIGSQFIGHGAVVPFEVTVKDPDHPLAARVQPFQIVDELYIVKTHAEFDAYLQAHWHHVAHPMAYTRTQGKGRVGYLALGHGVEAFNNPAFQSQVVRQLRWVCGESEAFERVIGCGIIGYGGSFNMGKHHAESINMAKGLQVVAVCDSDESRLSTAEDDLPGIKTYSSVDAMLGDDQIELCVLVTPHNTHAPLAIQCSKAGRHVVCEKPFALTIKESTDMIRAARKAGKVCTVFHNRRRDADYLTIKELIDAGEIGDVFQVEACMSSYSYPGDWWRSNKAISGGAFYDWGAHFIDWILNLIPRRIESVFGFFPPKRVWHHVTNEDHCWTTIRFEGGVMATFEQSSIAAVDKPKWRILGTRGAVTMGPNDTIRLVKVLTDGRKVESLIPFLKGDWHGYYRALADHLLLGDPLEVTPESARRVIGVLSLSEQSSVKGVPLSMPYEDEVFGPRSR